MGFGENRILFCLFFILINEIVCTGGHPFYVAELDKFIPARELEVGTKLLLSTGVCAIIEVIQVEQLEKLETTYNFEVEDFHTYYVTESNVLVHNMCGKADADDILNNIIDEPQSIQNYSLDEIKNIANQSDWYQGTLVRGPNKGLGFKVSSNRGSIIFNPGQAHHFNGAPYWKVSSGTKGVLRFLYLR